MFIIGPWQEFALARRLQAERAAERNVRQVLQNHDDERDEACSSKSAPFVPPLPRRPRSLAPAAAPNRAHRPPLLAPPPPPSPRSTLPPPPPVKARRKCRIQQLTDKTYSEKAQQPRRLRNVERMRRAYLPAAATVAATEGAASEGEEDERERKVEEEGRAIQNNEENEEEVDELMQWVKGLESEEEDDLYP